MSYQNLLTLDMDAVKKKKNLEEGKKPVKKKMVDSKSSDDITYLQTVKDGKPVTKETGKRGVKKAQDVDYDIPDRSYGDLYCPPCDSHMNSELMWEAHIRGKKHLKHAKQGNKSDLKFLYVEEDPEIQADLDASNEAMPGLFHLCEVQRNDQRPIYNCFLCSSNLATSSQVIEHLAGLKHRLAYLKEHDRDQHDMLIASQMRKGLLESVVAEHISQHEARDGRGRMKVRREKPKNEIDDEPPSKPQRKSFDRNRPSRPYGRQRGLHPPPDQRRQQPPERGIKSYRDRSGEREPPPPHRYHEEEPGFRRERRDFQDDLSPPPVFRGPPPSPRGPPPMARRPMGLEEETFYRRPPPPPRPVEAPVLPPPEVGRDLRELLDRRKVQEESAASKNVPDIILSLFEVLPPSAFLKLALFKLDHLTIQNDEELELLQKLMNKATTICLEMKEKQLKPILRAKFEQSMLHNGVHLPDSSLTSSSPVSADRTRIDQLVEYFKSQTSSPAQQGQDGPKREEEFWQRLPTTTPFCLASDPTPIPGLSLEEERPSMAPPYGMPSGLGAPPDMSPPYTSLPPADASPFERFATTTRDIFGKYPVMERPGERFR